MINEKEISVIIPVYNSEKTIGKVLESIINQTNANYIKEIIVVNDGSTDSSKTVVEEIAKDSVIPIIQVCKENKGVSHTRNMGMKKARGEWIAFCDSDDIWEKNKIEKQVEIVNDNSSIDLLGTNHIDRPLVILNRKIDYLYKATIKDLCIKMFPQTSTILMRKKIFDEIGGFDEKQRYAEDGNYMMNIVSKYNYYYMPERLVYYGDGKRGFGSTGLSANIQEMYKGNIKNIREIKEKGYISTSFYYLLRVFYYIKYIRRKIIIISTKKREREK